MIPGSFPQPLALVCRVAVLAYGRAATVPEGAPGGLRMYLLSGWGRHAAALFIDTSGVGTGIEGARVGFAPALSATAWLVLLVYTLEHHWFPQMQTRWLMSGVGMVAVILPLVFPGHALHSASSAWLPFPWMLGIASYALFAAAVVHAPCISAPPK